jgi:type II restriction enzyme
LLEHFKGNGVNISNLVDKIFEEKLKKMRKIKNKNIKVDGLPKNAWFNEISRILVASGEFMIPSKVKISSDCSASGGLVFVEKDGSINCTIYTSKDDARKYLYETSFLDTASTSRHSFGKIYKQPYDEFLAINLNLNIKGGN